MSNGNILQIMTHDFVQLFQLKLCEVLQKIFIVDLEIKMLCFPCLSLGKNVLFVSEGNLYQFEDTHIL